MLLRQNSVFWQNKSYCESCHKLSQFLLLNVDHLVARDLI